MKLHFYSALVGIGATLLAQPVSAQNPNWHRDIVRVSAADPKLKYSKIIIGVTDQGSRWMARAMDLVEAWDTPSAIRKLWVFIDHSKDATQKARESRMRVSVNCADKSYAILAIISYAPDGKIISNDSASDISSNYSAVIPETMAESVERELCGNDGE